MSKNKNNQKEVETVVANQELKMVTKAQGALEVVLQMIPREEVEKMIAQENRSNGEVVEG